MHVHGDAVLAQGGDDVHHPGIAQVRAVFLERQAQHQHLGRDRVDALADHQAHGLAGHVGAHAVVGAAPGQDHVRVVAHFLRLVGEVVRVHADAVAADQAGAERQEVPFGAGRFEHVQGVDAEAVEQDRQVVDQGDVEVALGVFDHLGRLGHLDAGGLVGAGGDDARVQRIDEIGGGRGGAGGHLEDGGDAVGLVAGVDALGRVAHGEGGRTGAGRGFIAQAGDALQDRDAGFLGAAGVDGGFVDHRVAGLEHLADGLAGLDQRGQVRAPGGVDRGGNGDDVDVAGRDVLQLVGEGQAGGLGQQLRLHFQGGVVALAQFGDAAGVDVEADGVVPLAEFHRQRQADIAQSDDGDARRCRRGDGGHQSAFPGPG